MKKKTTLIFTMIVLLLALTATVFAYVFIIQSNNVEFNTGSPTELKLELTRTSDTRRLIPLRSSKTDPSNETYVLEYKLTITGQIPQLEGKSVKFNLMHNLDYPFLVIDGDLFNSRTGATIEEKARSLKDELNHESDFSPYNIDTYKQRTYGNGPGNHDYYFYVIMINGTPERTHSFRFEMRDVVFE